MENILARLMEWGALYGIKVIGAIVILVVGRLLTNFLANLVKRTMEKSKADHTLTGFVRNLTRISLLIFTVIAALGSLGVETTSLIAVIGAAGLAVGFALQSSLSNIAVRNHARSISALQGRKLHQSRWNKRRGRTNTHLQHYTQNI